MFMVWDRVLRWKSFDLVSIFFFFCGKKRRNFIIPSSVWLLRICRKGKNSKL
jgi:hypothetical protein